MAERGHAFYFQNFPKRPFPAVVISDLEYFSLPKFLSMMAERGRVFYFPKRPFPAVVISDLEYFSLPNFLSTVAGTGRALYLP